MIKVATIIQYKQYVTTCSITVIKEWQQTEKLFTSLKETKCAIQQL